jgi:hypothetical protein
MKSRYLDSVSVFFDMVFPMEELLRRNLDKQSLDPVGDLYKFMNSSSLFRDGRDSLLMDFLSVDCLRSSDDRLLGLSCKLKGCFESRSICFYCKVFKSWISCLRFSVDFDCSRQNCSSMLLVCS